MGKNPHSAECSGTMHIPTWLIDSLDEPVRTDLRGIRDELFHWLLICTVLVAAGVILEGLEYLKTRNVHVRIHPFTGLRSRLATFVKFTVVLGWALVSVGVAG